MLSALWSTRVSRLHTTKRSYEPVLAEVVCLSLRVSEFMLYTAIQILNEIFHVDYLQYQLDELHKALRKKNLRESLKTSWHSYLANTTDLHAGPDLLVYALLHQVVFLRRVLC